MDLVARLKCVLRGVVTRMSQDLLRVLGDHIDPVTAGVGDKTPLQFAPMNEPLPLPQSLVERQVFPIHERPDKGAAKDTVSPGGGAFPGGRMEFGEHPIETLIRELEEETTITTREDYLIFTTYSHEFFPDQNKHYESLVFTVWLSEGEPEITEPDKCKEWKFFGIDDLPPNIFEPAKQTIEKFREPILTAMEEECKVGPMLRWAREQNAPR